jgi:hypothetical protein
MTFVKSKKPKPKSTKQHRSRSKKRKFVQPRSLEEFFAMPEKDQDLWNNIGQAVTEMRAGASRSKAARKFGIDPRELSELARPALRKLRNGRWAATKSDRLLRVLVIPTRKGLSEIGVRDSRQASLLGKFWTAVDRYRDTGDASALREFRGKYIMDSNGKRHRFLTDLSALDRLGSAGVLSFESLYARAA